MIPASSVLLLLGAATWMTNAWSTGWMLLATVTMFAALVLIRPPAGGGSRGSLPGRTTVALLLAYVALQASNPSHRYDAARDALLSLPHIVWLPHSADAPSTWRAGLTWFCTALLFWLVARRVSPAHHRFILAALAVHGFTLAVAGMLGRPEGVPARSPMGPFGNENNFAAYVNLLIPATLALGMDLRSARHAARSHPAYLVFFAAACMLAAVAVSESRAGLAVGCAQLILWGAMEWRVSGTNRARVAIALAVISAVVVAAVLAGTVLQRHLASGAGERLAIAWQMRVDAVRGTWAMFRDWPCYGVGAGTFARAFPYYQPDALPGYFRFAHNDWLQALAELGLAGTALLATALRYTLAPCRGGLGRLAGDRIARALALSLGGLAAHAWIDFPLQIHAIALLAAAAGGLIVARLSNTPPMAPATAK